MGKPNPPITSMVDAKKDPTTNTIEDTITSTDTTEDRDTTTMETMDSTVVSTTDTTDITHTVLMAMDITITTTPVITQDIMPIKDSLVLITNETVEHYFDKNMMNQLFRQY